MQDEVYSFTGSYEEETTDVGVQREICQVPGCARFPYGSGEPVRVSSEMTGDRSSSARPMDESFAELGPSSEPGGIRL